MIRAEITPRVKIGDKVKYINCLHPKSCKVTGYRLAYTRHGWQFYYEIEWESGVESVAMCWEIQDAEGESGQTRAMQLVRDSGFDYDVVALDPLK